MTRHATATNRFVRPIETRCCVFTFILLLRRILAADASWKTWMQGRGWGLIYGLVRGHMDTSRRTPDLALEVLRRFRQSYFQKLRPVNQLQTCASQIAEMLFDDLEAAVAAGDHAPVPRSRPELELIAERAGSADPREYVAKQLNRMRERIERMGAFRYSAGNGIAHLQVFGPTSTSRGGEDRGYVYLSISIVDRTADRDAPAESPGWLAEDVTADEVDTNNIRDATREDLERLLAEYSPILTLSQKLPVLLALLRIAWRVIVFDPALSAELLTSRLDGDDLAGKVLFPYCRLALREHMTTDELNGFLAATKELRTDPAAEAVVNVAWFRLLRALAYQQPGLLAMPAAHTWLLALGGEGGRFWARALVDLRYRSACGYLSLSLETEALLRDCSENYLVRYPGDVLSVLAPFILDTWEETRRAGAGELREVLLASAKRSADAVDARWCLTALQRAIPLLEFEDDDTEQAHIERLLLEEVDREVLLQSPQLLFAYLHCTLKEFLRNRNVRTLNRFEQLYRRVRRILVPPQRTHLQLEYAAALYLEHQFTNLADADLDFARILADGALLGSPLFEHRLARLANVKERPVVRGNGSLRGAIFSWLQSYIAALVRHHAPETIDGNVRRARELRIVALVPCARTLIGNLVQDKLRTAQQPPSPRWAAETAPIFSIVSPGANTKILRPIIWAAAEADNYSVQRNIRSIMQGLFVLHWFGGADAREASGIADHLAARIGFDRPHLWWAFYAGIRYALDAPEEEFVAGLWSAAQDSLQDPFTGPTPDDGAIFPASMIDSIRAFKESRFALTLGFRLNAPEVWNTLATSSLQLADVRTSQMYERAALFYHWADACARDRHNTGQKYRFNYLHARARAALLGSNIDEAFIRSTTRFLASRVAAGFPYRVGRTAAVVEMLAHYWTEFSAQMQTEVRTQLSRVRWLPIIWHDGRPEVTEEQAGPGTAEVSSA
jgi:hypothetical protein